MNDPDRETGTDAGAIATYAQEAATPKKIEAGQLYTVLVPDGDSLERIDTEHLLETPRRKRGSYTFDTVEAFSAYAREHLDSTRTTVWVTETGAVTAVFDDHGAAATGWAEHRAELRLRATDEWKHWTGLDDKLVAQEVFAQHIEDGIEEIVEPDGADLLELAQTFNATAEVSFRSAKRLSDGNVQFQYHEETQASGGRSGEMAVPQTFKFAVAPFLEEETVTLTARLRYRISSSKLQIGYRLVRPAEARRDALRDIRQRLAEELPRVYAGAAPA